MYTHRVCIQKYRPIIDMGTHQKEMPIMDSLQVHVFQNNDFMIWEWEATSIIYVYPWPENVIRHGGCCHREVRLSLYKRNLTLWPEVEFTNKYQPSDWSALWRNGACGVVSRQRFGAMSRSCAKFERHRLCGYCVTYWQRTIVFSTYMMKPDISSHNLVLFILKWINQPHYYINKLIWYVKCFFFYCWFSPVSSH